MRSPSRGTDGPSPCAPQRKEWLDPPVPEGEPGVGRDGEGRDRGDDRPLAPGRPLDGDDWRPAPGCLRGSERAARHRTECESNPHVERREVRLAGGPRESHSAGDESADAPEGTLEGSEQPERPAADRITHPSAVAVLQGARRSPGPVGLLGEARGAAIEVGGPWPGASRNWRLRVFSTACGTPQPSSKVPPGSGSSATMTRT